MDSIESLQELREIKKLLNLQKEVLTLEEFCLYAGISKHQAYHLTSKGKVKFYRPFGKMIYFNKLEVIEFLQQNEVTTSSTSKKVSKYLLHKSTQKSIAMVNL